MRLHLFTSVLLLLLASNALCSLVDVVVELDDNFSLDGSESYDEINNILYLDFADQSELDAIKTNQYSVYMNESSAVSWNPSAVSESEFDAASGGCNGQSFVARANEWVQARLKYCQAANGGRDASSSCPRVCRRQSNPAWDRYRSDCSGLVSYAWSLPPPGATTSTLNSAANVIQASQLRPGDAVNRAGSHTMLFRSWIRQGSEALFLEEPGCSTSVNYARQVQASVQISGSSITVGGSGRYTAIRKKGC